MALLGKFTKQPNEILDYDVDFTKWFSNRTDAPVSFTTTVQTGMTLVDSTLVGKVVKLVLSGGTDGNTYKVTVRLTTNMSLVKEADFQIKVKET
jgi:hypothetical protein